MAKRKKNPSLVTIKYRIGGSENQFVYWNLCDAEGNRLPVSDGGWNGVENNKYQAKKAAEHHARLAEQKLLKKAK